jgi:hypothetical protein
MYLILHKNTLYTKVNIMITLSKDQRRYYKINIIKHLYENKSF